MKIVSVSENKDFEKRIAITPEIAKKYISNGFEVSLIKNYGEHLGFKDQEFKEIGVSIIEEEEKIFENANIIAQLNLPTEERLSKLKENQNLIGILNPYSNKDKIDNLIKKKKSKVFLWSYYQGLPELNQWIFFHHRQTWPVIRR